jgi:hypothetical protein
MSEGSAGLSTSGSGDEAEEEITKHPLGKYLGKYRISNLSSSLCFGDLLYIFVYR